MDKKLSRVKKKKNVFHLRQKANDEQHFFKVVWLENE